MEEAVHRGILTTKVVGGQVGHEVLGAEIEIEGQAVRNFVACSDPHAHTTVSDRRERDDDRRDRDRDRDRDRERDRRDERRRRDDDRDRDRDRRDDKRDLSHKERNQDSSHRPRDEDVRSSQTLKAAMPTNVPGSPHLDYVLLYMLIRSYDLTDTTSKPVISRPNLDPDAPDEEEGEAMDAENEDDAAMMAMMGMSGFGSTKVCMLSQSESPEYKVVFFARERPLKGTKRVEYSSRNNERGDST